jgi:hypothetical protein
MFVSFRCQTARSCWIRDANALDGRPRAGVGITDMLFLGPDDGPGRNGDKAFAGYCFSATMPMNRSKTLDGG